MRVVCSGRWGGVSRPPFATCNVADHVGDDPAAVAANRARVAAAAGLPGPAAWVWLRQVHGAGVHRADAPTSASAPPEADAAVTTRVGLPLAVTTADCAPVVLAAPAAVAVVHAGHRGLVAGVLEATVGRLRDAGARRIEAFLGPCIRPARYEFGRDDLARVVARLGPGVAGTTRDGRPALDVPAAVRAALARVGVDAVHDCGVCTAGSGDHFSHRRDGPTGRQVTVAVLT